MFNKIERLLKLLTRNIRALNLGFKFKRASSFKLPQKILLNGNFVDIKIPTEESQKIAFIEILLDDCYALNKLKKKGGEIKTILDIGSNIGLFGIAARINFPLSKIYCYEPNISLEPNLKQHSELFSFNYFMKAVSNLEGNADIKCDKESVFAQTSNNIEGSIQKISLKNILKFIGKDIDLLKIDCEGAEWEIIKSKIDWNKIKNLAIEYHIFEEYQSAELFIKNLTSLGFVIENHLPCDGYGLLNASRVKKLN